VNFFDKKRRCNFNVSNTLKKSYKKLSKKGIKKLAKAEKVPTFAPAIKATFLRHTDKATFKNIKLLL